MNELEMTAEAYEEILELYRQLNAEEFDGLYATEQARLEEPALPVASNNDECPW